jgi:type I site-specific restriction endonuclease
LNFRKEGEQTEGLAEGDNPLNLPYSDSEPEQDPTEKQGDVQTEQLAEAYPNLPSPTPPEEQNRPLAEASASRPRPARSQKINQLLKKVYELEVSEKQIKKKNAELVDKNVELYDISQDVMDKYDKTLDKNKLLMKENTKLNRQLRLLRLKMKETQTPTPKHSGLETLAELATSLEKETEPPTQQIEVSIPVQGGAASPKRP